MNLHEYLLNEFHTATGLDMYVTIILYVIIGIYIGSILGSRSDLCEFYKKGQIDALNGIVKYEKRENDIKEIVWMEKPEPKETNKQSKQ